jgi:putative salt-induced outer membrane protein
MRTKKYVLCLLLTVAANGAFAQAAATVTNAAPPKPKWDTTVNIGMTLTRGNSEAFLAAGDIGTVRKWDKNEVSLGADGVYGKTDGTENANQAHGFGQYNRLFTERLYGYARVDAWYDAIADINYRVSISPGAGYYVVKTANTSLKGEVGPGYVFEKVGGVTDDYPTLRLAERFEQKIKDRTKLWEVAEYVPQVDKFANYVINAEIGLETAISKNVTQRICIQDNYRSEPAPGKKNNDVKLIVALGYKF